MVKVSIPVTNADLGLGENCLGIALQERFEIVFQRREDAKCSGVTENHMVYQAFLKGLSYVDEPVFGVDINIQKIFTTNPAFGCQAAYILGGLMAANMMSGNKMNKYEIFSLACSMQDNPAYFAPALFGGLCVTFYQDKAPNMIRYGVKRDWLFLCMIPDNNVQHKTRYSHPKLQQDKHSFVGACCAMAKGVEIGNALIVKKALSYDTLGKDEMYQDIRAICEKDALTSLIVSKDQSVLFAMTQNEEHATYMQEQIHKLYPTWQVSMLTSTYDGAYCEEV